MRLKIFLLLTIALTTCLPTVASAAEQYVTDQLVLSLRKTANPGSAVIGHLKTDAAVEILSESGAFAKVRSAVGTGYVRKQYLTATPPKQITINQQADELKTLKAKLNTLSAGDSGKQQELETLRKTNAQLQRELKQARSGLSQLQQRYDKILANSKDLLAIIKQRDQLLESNSQLEAEADSLREENSSLLATGIIKWFLAGGGTLFFGWFMGKISRKRRRAF